jgi:hypothetical protein
MTKENQKQAITLNEVMPIVNKITDAAWSHLPSETTDTVQEMFELLMTTPFADDIGVRTRAYLAVVALRNIEGPINELCAKTNQYVK